MTAPHGPPLSQGEWRLATVRSAKRRGRLSHIQWWAWAVGSGTGRPVGPFGTKAGALHWTCGVRASPEGGPRRLGGVGSCPAPRRSPSCWGCCSTASLLPAPLRPLPQGTLLSLNQGWLLSWAPRGCCLEIINRFSSKDPYFCFSWGPARYSAVLHKSQGQGWGSRRRPSQLLEAGLRWRG